MQLDTTPISVDIKDLVRERIIEQCYNLNQKRTNTIISGICRFKMLHLLDDDNGHHSRSIILPQDKQDQMDFNYHSWWDIDYETGIVEFVKGNVESAFFGEVLLNNPYDPDTEIVMVPSEWLDPDLTEESVLQLMERNAKSQYAKVVNQLLESNERMINHSIRQIEHTEQRLAELRSDMFRYMGNTEVIKSRTFEEYIAII